MNKRQIIIAAATMPALGAVAACTATTTGDVEKQVADFINQVQAGVVAGCKIVGKLVPTANSVIAVIGSIAGTNPAVVTAAVIAQAIAAITQQACSAVPKLSESAGGVKTVVVGKVVVEFY